MTAPHPMQTEILERLSASASAGERPGIALGAYGLVHAGTVAFLRRASRHCDRLFVAILPQVPSADENAERGASLLRPDERARILAMMVEVDGGAALLESAADLSAWRDAAGDAATWMCAEAENDLSQEALAEIERLGLSVQAIANETACSTSILLERLAR